MDPLVVTEARLRSGDVVDVDCAEGAVAAIVATHAHPDRQGRVADPGGFGRALRGQGPPVAGRSGRQPGMVNDIDWAQVVGAATRPPSIHNTQPWRFVASRDRLEVIHDRE